MEIKGTSVKGTKDFVKNNFPSRYEEWISSVSEETRELFEGTILTNKWYPIKAGLTDPIKCISTLFYNGDDQYTSFFMGSYHAEKSLTGIYRFFVRMNSPLFIIERGIEVLGTYFRPSDMKVETRNNNTAIIHIYPYNEPHIIIESSIEGWAKKAIEISGGKNVQTKIVKSLTRGGNSTEIALYWED